MLTLATIKRVGCWLLGMVLFAALLLAATLLAAKHFLSTPAASDKIRHILAARTGLEMGYAQADLGYFPTPSLALHQLTFTLPGQLTGKADTLRITPQITELLTGSFNLGRVELERPDINLELPQPQPAGQQADAAEPPGVKRPRAMFAERLLQSLPVLHLHLADGRFAIASGPRKLTGAHLELTADGAVENARGGRVRLQLNLAELALHSGKQTATIKGVHLKGDLAAADGRLVCRLNPLSLAAPALMLTGHLAMPQDGGGVDLHLAGTGIDVDAVRTTALALAGDSSPVKEIFTYLVGGTVPQIDFSARGNNLSELGDLNNMRLEGQLQRGAVSVPEIKMRLTEVSGNVAIADGILSGTDLLARVNGATGHFGQLKLGLAEENDLFQLEIMVNADVAQLPSMVKNIVQKPEVDREIDRITNLKGRAAGKLVLGDRLADLQTSIELADTHLSCTYQQVPYPIALTKGSFNLAKGRIELRGVDGAIGKSEIAGFGGTVDWAKKVRFAVKAEHAQLSADELYPWLNTMDNAKAWLKDFKEITGSLELSAFSLGGDADAPWQWSYATAGATSGLQLKTRFFPGPIRLTNGAFKLDRSQLALQRLAVAGLDANLALNGTVSGLASKSGPEMQVTIDGVMGQEAVAWLQATCKIPEAYALRAPLTLSGVKGAWRPQDKAGSVNGGFSLKDGPRMALEARYQPEGLQVEKLDLNDRTAQARLAFFSGRDGLRLRFDGRLGSETLEGVFLHPPWGKGTIEGEAAITLPAKAQTGGATANGHLKGTNLQLPLGSGQALAISQILLQADGSNTIKADAAAVSWRDFTWNPMRAVLTPEADGVAIKLDQAALCGVHSPGVVRIGGNSIDLDLMLNGKELDVSTSYACLTQGKVRMTGTMELSGRIKARGARHELISTLQGPLKMTFSNGVMEQNRLLSALLEVLNVTEIVKGRLPDMTAAGFRYSVITVDGQFANGKLLVEKLYLDGETLDVLGYGEINLEKETLNLELLAAPFKTVDTIIKYIPGVNYLMDNSLVVIPVKVTGSMANPRVTVTPASLVSTRLLNFGARTLRLPSKVIESIINLGTRQEK